MIYRLQQLYSEPGNLSDLQKNRLLLQSSTCFENM